MAVVIRRKDGSIEIVNPQTLLARRTEQLANKLDAVCVKLDMLCDRLDEFSMLLTRVLEALARSSRDGGS